MNNDGLLCTIYLPKIGESITEGTVVAWLKKEGDLVEKDEPIVEIATDKINSEIPSPEKGRIQKILQYPQSIVQVGQELCVLTKDTSSTQEDHSSFYSPAVLHIAKMHKMSMHDLEKIPYDGSRLRKKDVESYLQNISCEMGETTQRIAMTPLRKTIAKNMVRSFYQAPHASLVSEVDVTKIVCRIQEEKERFFQEHQVKLTITTLVARALIRAIRCYPLINSSLEDNTIVLKKFVNLGIAVSVEEGVLVPVIKQAESLALPELSKAIADLAKKARSFSLHPQETENGSITLTNFGMAKAKIGIPIIRYPEVAIVGIGAVEKKVAVLDDNSFGIRSTMHVSLTFDHRVIDGMYGCGFLQEIKQQLEEEIERDFSGND